MIKSKKELQFYISADRMMNRGYFNEPVHKKIINIFMPDYIMKYLDVLRRAEYFSNRGGYYNTGINAS